MSKAKEWRVLTFTELIKRAHSDDEAKKALDTYHQIEKRQGKRVIRYPEFHGYRVKEQFGDG